MSGTCSSCVQLNEATFSNPDRVGVIADAKPGCACESEMFSLFSPGVIGDDEIIARVVCEPMHVHPKRLELKPSFFSHAFTVGASVQRLELAKDVEFVDCVSALVAGKEDRAWLGYVTASASEIRRLMYDGEVRAYGVYDAALEHNPAHAEIHSARRIPEADQMEIRKQLRDLFARAGFHGRKKLRDRRVWDALPEQLKARPVGEAWQEMAG